MPKKTQRDPEPVNIAHLKANLATYLRKAEKGGAITIVDRHRPIARLVGLESKEGARLSVDFLDTSVLLRASFKQPGALPLKSIKSEVSSELLLPEAGQFPGSSPVTNGY